MTVKNEMRLRYYTGPFEEQLVLLVLSLQFAIVIMVGLGAVGFMWFTLGTLSNTNESILAFTEMIPYLIGGGVTAFVLNQLYESQE